MNTQEKTIRMPRLKKRGISCRPLCGRRGIGTLEVVIIIAVLLSVALIFRQALTDYATELIDSVFGDQSAIADLYLEDDHP